MWAHTELFNNQRINAHLMDLGQYGQPASQTAAWCCGAVSRLSLLVQSIPPTVYGAQSALEVLLGWKYTWTVNQSCYKHCGDVEGTFLVENKASTGEREGGGEGGGIKIEKLRGNFKMWLTLLHALHRYRGVNPQTLLKNIVWCGDQYDMHHPRTICDELRVHNITQQFGDIHTMFIDRRQSSNTW
jgi:hypothetical protein